jgi:glucosamine--fructose-6-phosphate aminotransferase (isomerizing)
VGLRPRAGPEASIAATKSYIAQLVAGARVVAAWQGDPVLQKALDALPTLSNARRRKDWRAGVDLSPARTACS